VHFPTNKALLYGRNAVNAGITVTSYSTDISAAWEVVEKMNDWDISIIKAGDYCEVAFGSQQPIIRKTVQEAICKAALISVLLREAPSID
jgi:hypothetical protein